VELRNIDQAAVPAHRSDAASSDVERSGQADSSSASPKAEASSSPWQREVALPSMPSPAYVPTAPEPERREPSRAPSPKNASNALPLVIAAVVVGGAIVAAAVFLKDELASLRRDRPKDDSAVRIGLGSDAATPAAAEPVAPTPTTSASASATTPRPLTAPPKPVANPGSTSPASQPNSAPTAKPAPAPTGAKFVPDGL
jgi:hypothetical protein